MRYEHVLLTGAAGRIGHCLRDGLRDAVRDLRLTDLRPIEDLARGETFVQADLCDAEAVGRAVAGMQAVVHLGGVPDEAPFEVLEGPNLRGTFNVFDAARRAGVRRVVYASSNRITGFYPASRLLDGNEPVRPDGLYGATKAFGEALGRLYADKFGLEVVCVRIGSFEERPSEVRHLTTWLSPADAVRLFTACLEAPDVGFETVYGVSANTRRWWDLEAAARLGYEPRDDAELYAAGLPDEDAGSDVQGGRFARADYGGWAL
jgi:uronate dehydrogenase